jgi:hypothetical protein
MSAAHRCPHCRTELPEKATFCANCGRRIEGWKVARDATPAMGEAALPDGDEATKQMEPTPSLLRAAALSLRRRKRGPPIVAMALVAVGGALAAFIVVRAGMRKTPSRSPSPIISPPTITPTMTPTTPTPTPTIMAAPTPTKPPSMGKPKRAHRVAAAPVINVKAAPKRKMRVVASSAGGLPHKGVATDSKSVAQQEAQSQKAMALPTVEHETTESKPQGEAEMKQEAEARLDADSVRFVVKAHLPQVRACYGRAFKDSSPGGTVEIGFAIDASGRAQNVRTETNTSDSDSLARCLEERVKQWQFPKPVGGDYELIYPFVFAPGS